MNIGHVHENRDADFTSEKRPAFEFEKNNIRGVDGLDLVRATTTGSDHGEREQTSHFQTGPLLALLGTDACSRHLLGIIRWRANLDCMFENCTA
jgi:hypothetical protein